MSKVFIVLNYLYHEEKDMESCKVDRVYTTRKKAQKRVNFLVRVDPRQESSYHIIEKKLKGKIMELSFQKWVD